MLQKMKKSMRISHNNLDSDIERNIEACELDLNMAGVWFESADDLIEKAIELYLKWQYDYGGKGEQFEKAYGNLKDALGLCGDYNIRPDN